MRRTSNMRPVMTRSKGSWEASQESFSRVSPLRWTGSWPTGAHTNTPPRCSISTTCSIPRAISWPDTNRSARRWRVDFEHVLVDEFQDTDPLQIDILWRLCGEARKDGSANPLARALRPGALFLVGDPKQAIYRFRGADVNAYIGARTAIGDEGLLKITANFRSVEPILSFVNDKFEAVLSTAAGQPGFAELSPTCKAQPGTVAVAALDVADEDDANADQMRDAEANRVADLCSRLVGNRLVRGRNGVMRPCRLGDIALLAPVGTDLWRFEEALEDRGVAVSTQAGKGFFRRQEIQDLIALTRTLADGRDTLGARRAAPRPADRVDRSRVAGHRRSPSARRGPS